MNTIAQAIGLPEYFPVIGDRFFHEKSGGSASISSLEGPYIQFSGGWWTGRTWREEDIVAKIESGEIGGIQESNGNFIWAVPAAIERCKGMLTIQPLSEGRVRHDNYPTMPPNIAFLLALKEEKLEGYESIYRWKFGDLGSVAATIYADRHDESIVRLGVIEATPPGTGMGSKVLRSLAQKADQLRVELRLIPVPKPGSGWPVDRLVAFYRRFEFAPIEGDPNGQMYRYPLPAGHPLRLPDDGTDRVTEEYLEACSRFHFPVMYDGQERIPATITTMERVTGKVVYWGETALDRLHGSTRRWTTLDVVLRCARKVKR